MADFVREFALLLTPANLAFSLAFTVFGMLVVFYLTPATGRQTKYILSLPLHPLHLLRGHLLCPQCLGKGRSGEFIGDPNLCFFCVNQHLFANMPLGYVCLKDLVRAWNWMRWQRRSQYAFVPKQPTAR